MFPWDSRSNAENASTVPSSVGSRSQRGGSRGSRAASAALPKVQQQKKRGLRSAASWASAQARMVGKKTTLPTGGSAPPVTTLVSLAAPPQMPRLVNGKVPTNDKGYLLQLGSQAGFRGRWYCGRILDPADLPGASDQCGPEGGPQCDSCARFQATYEPDLNDDGFPVKRSSSVTHCYYFYCGRPGVVTGSAGACGPQEGPQCSSCQRLQDSFKACHVNDEGCMVLRGTRENYKGKYYCGRLLGVKAIPGSDGRCGPEDGPQCNSCQRFLKSQQIVIDPEESMEVSATSHTSSFGAITAPAETASVAPAAVPEVKVKLEEKETMPSTKASVPSTQPHPISDKPPQQSRTILRSGASSEAITTEINDEGCALTYGTEDGFRERYYCGRKLGTAAIPGSSDGRCGPGMGPQCGSCQRFQRSKEVSKNDEGAFVRLGTEHGFRNTYFCGRGFLDSHSGAAFRCGPDMGPQCGSCRRFQMMKSSGSRGSSPSEPKHVSAVIKPEQSPSIESRPSAARVVEKTSKQAASAGRATKKHTSATPSKVSEEHVEENARKLVDSGVDANSQQIHEEAVVAEKKRKPQAQRGKDQSLPKASPQQAEPVVPEQPRVLCVECGKGDREADLLLCDGPGCERATHLHCCKPKLKAIPEGKWLCKICAPPRTPKARKQVEVATAATRSHDTTLCCSVCNKSDREDELLVCDTPGCGKATHLSCCKPKLKTIPAGDWFCSSCVLPKTPKGPQPRKHAQTPHPSPAQTPHPSPAQTPHPSPPVPKLLCSVCCLGDREAELLLCDTPGCERSTHMSCCRPKLKAIPEDDWFCNVCAPPQAAKRRASPQAPPVAASNQGAALLCSVCHKGDRAAELLLCDTPGCPIATHYSCCQPPFESCPVGDWFCAVCDPPAPPAKKRKTARGSKVDEPRQPRHAAKGLGKGSENVEVSFGAAIRAALNDATNVD